MKKFFVHAILGLSILLTVPLAGIENSILNVSAQSPICNIFPFLDSSNYLFGGICSGDGESNVSTVIALVQLALALIFIGIIIVAIFVIIKAAVKYIRSEGTAEKVEEAKNAIKQVFMGIGALFFGIIGIILILVLFDSLAATTSGPTDGTTGGLNSNPVLDPLIPNTP